MWRNSSVDKSKTSCVAEICCIYSLLALAFVVHKQWAGKNWHVLHVLWEFSLISKKPTKCKERHFWNSFCFFFFFCWNRQVKWLLTNHFVNVFLVEWILDLIVDPDDEDLIYSIWYIQWLHVNIIEYTYTLLLLLLLILLTAHVVQIFSHYQPLHIQQRAKKKEHWHVKQTVHEPF